MTQTTLRAVTLKTVANYTQAAERAVGAYRAGGHRLINAVQRSVDRAAQQGAERLAPRLAAALRRASGNMTGLASKGLDAVSSGTERAIELGSSGVSSQLGRVADLVEGVDNRVVVSGVQAAVRISMPGAQAALMLSERVAAGADKLPGAPVKRVKLPVVKAKRAAPAGRRTAAKLDAPVQAVAENVTKNVTKNATKNVVNPLKKAKKAVAPLAAEVVSKVKAEVKTAAKPKAVRKAVAKPIAKPAAKPVTVVAKAPRARRAAKASPAVAAVAEVSEASAA